jgi:hypothetical protein
VSVRNVNPARAQKTPDPSLTPFALAPGALDNLKSKLKAIFKKKPEQKPAETKPEPAKATETAPATEPAKTEEAPPSAPASMYCSFWTLRKNDG